MKNDFLTTTVLALFLLSMQILTAVFLNNEYQEKYKLVEHTNKIIDKTNNFKQTLLNCETGQRGYLLTQNEKYLEPFEKNKNKLIPILEELKTLLKNNDMQLLKVDEIYVLTEKKLYELDETINLTKLSNGFNKAYYIVNQNKGKEYMDSIRLILNQIVRTEKELLKNRTQSLNKSHKNTILIYLFEIVLIVMFLVLYKRKNNKLNEYIDKLNSAKKQSQKDKKKFENMFENHSDIMLLVDPETTKIINANKSACLFYGYSKQQFLEKKLADINLLSQEQLNRKIELAKKENENIFIFEHKLKNGQIKSVEVHSSPIEYEQSKVLFSIIRDVTEKVNLQKSIEESNRRLKKSFEEAQVAEEEAVCAQEELLVIQEQLISANEAKSQFLANMSHEIRTPLNGIIGITDIILEDDNIENSLKENLKIVQKSSHSLRGIINDILDFSKIQNGKFEIIYEEFSLREVINDVKDLYKPLIKQKDLEFKVQVQDSIVDTIIGDELRVRQILNNIVGNSLKFTNKGSIDLKVKEVYTKNERTTLSFEVSDTGIGMSQKVQDKIFESFTQGEHSNTKNYQGSGLGLTISKSLIELMGGKIRFISNEGHGTSFYIQLSFNFKKDKQIEPKKKTKQLKLKTQKTALVAEDNDINQIVINKLLQQMGFVVEFANDGIEAVNKAQMKSYDIIFMDLQMPNMDGFEAAKKIRSFNDTIAIVALSAAVMSEDKHKSLESGMNFHISKPIEKAELFKVIENYFELTVDNSKIKENKNISNILINGIDIKTVSEIFDGDIQNVYALYIKFAKDYQNIKNDLEYLNKDSKEFKEYLHKLKGVSGNLKINDVFELSKKIYDQNKIELLNKLIENIKFITDQIQSKIKPIVDKTLVNSQS